MNPIQLFDPASSTYTYILADEATGEALIIDPVDEQLERDLSVLRDRGLKLVWSVETHAHADHITSAGLLAEHAGAHTAAPQGCNIGTAGTQLRHGDELQFGKEKIRALHTPGHTAGSMCFLWRNHVFTGDTLLIGGCGRTDFQSGSSTDLYRSITEVLFALPDDTVVWPGHDYNGRRSSTIGHEKATNPRVAGRSLAEFKAIMDQLNLPKPKRLDEAVPANLSSGQRHDAGGGALEGARPAAGYAGDVSPELAYKWWQEGSAVLVDVRSQAEIDFVGFIPGAVHLPWKEWPGMKPNPGFDEAIKAAVPPGKKAVMLCRSGARSASAAKRATEFGIEAYNILEGFEGDKDEHGQRGHKGGWRVRGLPWRQN